MLGSAILAAVVIVAVCSFRRMEVAFVSAVIAFVAVPEVEVWTLGLPGVGGVNIGVLVILCTAALQIAFRAQAYASDLAARPAVWLALGAWTAGGTITNFVAATSGVATGAWLEIVVAPPLAYLLTQRLAADAPQRRTSLAHAVVVIAAFESALALTVWAGLVPQPFATAYATYDYWWTPDFDRALGTLDHPLALAGLLLVATALLGSVRRNTLVVGAAALFLVTIVLTQSRSALALAVVAFLVVLLRRRLPFVANLGLALVSVATLAVVLVTNPEIASGLTLKLDDDNGSANARVVGLGAFLPIALTDPLVGAGEGSSFEVARTLGLGTSFENPVIMTALDWGLVASLAFVLAQSLVLVGVVRHRGDRVPGAALAAVVVSVYVLTYSSYALASGLGMFVWLLLGLAAPASGPGGADPAAVQERGSVRDAVRIGLDQ